MKIRPSVFGWAGLTLLLMILAIFLPGLPMLRFAPSQPPPPALLPIPKHPPGPADVAVPKTWKDGTIDPGFLELHNRFLAQGKSDRIDLLFLGDSITQAWSTTGKAIWATRFSACHPANFGSAGDRTQHLLWRIENGELDNVKPQVVVLLIGTNNTDYPAADIIQADEKIVRGIHEKLPRTRLVVMGIFPRDCFAIDEARQKIKFVNAELSKLEDGHATRYLDIGDKFLRPDGRMNFELMPDLLHPSEKGYQIWADALQPLLNEMTK